MAPIRWRVAILLCCVAMLQSLPASAQYFGQNKVQYQNFDFQVLKTEHFDIYFYPREQEAAALAARMAERWYARLTRALDHHLSGRQPLVLYASHPDFEQTGDRDHQNEGGPNKKLGLKSFAEEPLHDQR